MIKPGTGREDTSTDIFNHSLISTPLRSMETMPSKRRRDHLQALEKLLAVKRRTKKKEPRILGLRRLSPSKLSRMLSQRPALTLSIPGDQWTSQILVNNSLPTSRK